MSKINKIKALLGIEVNLAEAKLENGTIIESESFEAGQEVFIKSEEEAVALPVGEYDMEDGKVLVVEEEGIIAEIKDKETEEEESQDDENVEVDSEKECKDKYEEQELENVDATNPKKIVKTISEEVHFKALERIKELEGQLEAIELAKQEAAEQKAKIDAELAEDVKPITHNPEGKAEKKSTFLYGQKAPSSIKTRIYDKLYNK